MLPPASMLILAIENSNPSAVIPDSNPLGSSPNPNNGPGIAVLRVEPSAGVSESTKLGTHQPLSYEPIRPVARDKDDLLPAIDRAMRASRITPRDLTHIAVSVGPGGYTAVRAACSAGKMIACAVGARCVAVRSSLVAALGLLEEDEALVRQGFAVCLAGKDATSHAARFGPVNHWAEIPEVMQDVGLVGPAEIESLRVPVLVADRFLPAAVRTEAIRLGIRVVEPRFRADLCARLASVVPTCEAEHLNPFYAREPDAVTLWRSRR